MITFKPLETTERNRLADALKRNAVDDNSVILMGRRDTSFVGTSDQVPSDEEVVAAIRSVPCHY